MADPRAEPLLVDTSIWIRADRTRQKQKGIQERLKTLVVSGSAHICWPIRTEILIGARDAAKFESLDQQLSALPDLPIVDQTWREAARLGRELARKGQAVPLIDLLVASIAIESGITLWTIDSDFRRVQSVRELRVDWSGMS